MYKFVLLILFVPTALLSQTLRTKYERSGKKETPTYQEIIAFWKQLDQASPHVIVQEMGPTDAGYPLHLVLVNNEKDFSISSIKRKNKRIIFINNGIHPGEPDGIDASMLLVRDLVAGRKKLPANVVLAIIPVYNIGGCLNRSEQYRVDQNGPEAFGFRGNSQNLDLNRDFIKNDSKEAITFAEIFHLLDPDVFVDNHVSNGADYQHVMTLLTSQHDKLGGAMGAFLNQEFEPGLYGLMKQKGYDLVPYVHFSGGSPENGLTAYFDGPRYSSGYASLWHTFAFVPETHMLKSYDQRVEATYALMECFIAFTQAHGERIRSLRAAAKKAVRTQDAFPVGWTLDRSRSASVVYKGYESGRKPSLVSGMPRLYYDRSKPYERTLQYFNTYVPRQMVKKPVAYVIPQGWWKVIELLHINQVQFKPLVRDTVMEVEVYTITDYQTSPRPYEMHHLNSNVRVRSGLQRLSFRKGDVLVPMNQEANRFLIEVLEPQGDDSYFAWNFFDGILGQKEGYSAYAFEDIAAAYLEKHPEVRNRLQERVAADSVFAKSGSAQLDFVYRNSPYYEPDHMRYPVYRLMK